MHAKQAAEIGAAVAALASAINAAGYQPSKVGAGLVKALARVPRGAEARFAVCLTGDFVDVLSRRELADAYRRGGKLEAAAQLAATGAPGRLAVLVDYGGARVMSSTPARLKLLAAALQAADVAAEPPGAA
jgi:hypothetical protein